MTLTPSGLTSSSPSQEERRGLLNTEEVYRNAEEQTETFKCLAGNVKIVAIAISFCCCIGKTSYPLFAVPLLPFCTYENMPVRNANVGVLAMLDDEDDGNYG